jgi:hypothetical protein
MRHFWSIIMQRTTGNLLPVIITAVLSSACVIALAQAAVAVSG